MKRILLATVAVIGLSISSFAAGKQPVAINWEGHINIAKLSSYLNLSASQTEEVANISSFLDEQMEHASRATKNQDKLLHDAVYGNLKLMKQTLTNEQYAKYLRVMNLTLYNKGIEVK